MLPRPATLSELTKLYREGIVGIGRVLGSDDVGSTHYVVGANKSCHQYTVVGKKKKRKKCFGFLKDVGSTHSKIHPVGRVEGDFRRGQRYGLANGGECGLTVKARL